MKETKRRLISMLLAIVMVITVLPVYALAESTVIDDELLIADQEGQSDSEEHSEAQPEEGSEPEVTNIEAAASEGTEADEPQTEETQPAAEVPEAAEEEEAAAPAGPAKAPARAPAGGNVKLDTSAVPTSIKLDTDYDLLASVTVSPTEIDGEQVLIRVKEVKSNSTSDFDSSGDYNAETHILNARSDDGTHSRALAEYEVTYEAYIGEVVLDTDTITVSAFDDSRVGEETSGDVAYISNASVEEVTDGTAAWDSSDDPGYDSGAKNGIVRTYDTVDYEFSIENKVYSGSDYRAYMKGRVGFEFVLPGDSSQIMFNTDAMAWLNSKDGKYKILEVKDGGNTYQVMRGTFLWDSNDPTQPAIGAGQSTVTASYRVLAMKNGDTVKPYFTFWMDGNDVPQKDVPLDSLTKSNYQLVYQNSQNCASHGSKETVTIEGDETKVSAYPWLDIRLQPGNTDMGRILRSWDFSTGNEKAPNKDAGAVYGRSAVYGFTVMMRRPDGSGLRGVEFPQGPITFDVNLTSAFKIGSSTTDVTEEFTPLLWSLEENVSGSLINSDGRQLGEIGYAQFTPTNRSGAAATSCYSGGTWSGVQEGTVVHVTVEGYQINTSRFPWRAGGYAESATTFYNPDNVKNYWDIGMACFSAGELWYIQPFYSSTDGTYILDYLGQDSEDETVQSGTFQTVITDTHMQATGVSGTAVADDENDNNAQTNRTNDKNTAALALMRPGSINSSLFYAPYNNAAQTTPLTDGCYETGEDWATLGTKLSIFYRLRHDGAEGDSRGIAYDNLVKFDDEFMEVERVRDLTTGYDGNDVKFYFAAKPDGSGWRDDNEMKLTVADELVYYSSLAELESAGKTCVGVLLEARGLASSSRVSLAAGVDAVVKDTAEVDHVYMTTISSRSWRVSDVRQLVEANLGHGATDEEIDAWAKANMPSVTDGTAYSVFPHAFWIKAWKDKDGKELIKDLDYQKAVYDENGFAGASAGIYNGDSCLVVGDKASIQIKALQTSNSGSAYSAEDTGYYDMDYAQRVADFQILPSIVPSGAGSDTGDAAAYTTDVTVTVTLPDKLTYINGSAYYGGEYEQPARHGRQGSVANGQVFDESDPTSEYALTVSDDGKTLTFVIHNYLVDWSQNDSITLPDIYYSCDIGNIGGADDVVNNEELVTTASIQTTVDHSRPIEKDDGNLDDCTVKISKGAMISIVDRANQVAVDVNKGATPAENTSAMRFNMKVVNDAQKEKRDAVVVAHTPYSADRASSFNGTANVTAFQLTNAPEGMKVYYTTEDEALAKDDYTSDDLTRWTELTVGSDGTVTLPAGENITAIAVNGTIPGNYSMELTSTIELTGAQPGDVLSHSFTYNGMAISARSYVVSRAITGVAWKDENHDGIRQSGETLYEGVTVTLYKLKASSGGGPNGAPRRAPVQNDAYEVYTVDGNPVTTKTDANGAYRFEDMPAGTYAVDFEDPDGSAALSTYRLTEQNAGSDDSIDSDAEEVADNHYRVAGIVMVPTDEITVQRYTKANNDAGFYRPDLTVTKTVTGDLTDEEQAADRTFYFQAKVTGAETEKTYDTETVAADGSTTDGTVTSAQLAAGYEFSLKDGEQFVIKAIPVGAKYTVSEGNYTQFGYTTTKDNDSNTLNDDQTAAFTNAFTPETVNITAKKTWSGDSDEVRPESVTVQLLKNGDEEDTQTLNADDWSYTWEKLPKYDCTWPTSYSDTGSRTEISYSVAETAAAGTTKTTDGKYILYNKNVSVKDSDPAEYAVVGYYTSNVSDANGVYTFVNTWHPAKDKYTGTAGFTVAKVDQDGAAITTGSATFLLEQQGENDSRTTVDSYQTTNGTVTIGGLSEGTYCLTETEAPEGYVKSETEYSITVTHTGDVLVAVTEESGTYTNNYEKTLVLTADGDTWSADEQTLTVSNKQITGTIEISKAVQDTKGAAIDTENEYTFNVYKEGDETSSVAELTVKAGESAKTEPLPYGEYVVKEATDVPSIEGYDYQNVTIDHTTVSIEQDNQELTVAAVNSYRRIVGKVSVTKAAEDLAGNTIDEQRTFTFHIYRQGEEDGTPVQTLTVKNGDTVTSAVLDYGRYTVVEDTDEADMDGYVFRGDKSTTSKEIDIDEYDKTETVDARNVYNPLVKVSGAKTWDDANNQDGVRPEEITIHLFANQEEMTDRLLTVTAADNWSWSFENLLKYDDDGNEIEYTITEDEVDLYDSEVDGYDVTNTHEPELISIDVEKIWEDEDNRDGIRPEDITVRLLADGTEVDSAALTKADDWTHTFTDLPKYAPGQVGKEVVYTVTEDAVDNYTTEIDQDAYVITNHYAVNMTSVTVTKAWDDDGDRELLRPTEGVMVQLYANGEALGDAVELTEAGKWTYTWSELNLNEPEGVRIAYTVEEVSEIEGYTLASVEGDAAAGFVLTNLHEIELTSVSGAKTWDDGDDQDGIRPEEITIHLYADGEELADQTVTVTAADDWSWSFEGLPKYDGKEEIVYTIAEDEVDGYSAVYDGCSVTNIHTPETISVPVTKVWADEDDKDGIRPDAVTVKLLANGADTGERVVLSKDNGYTAEFTELDKYAAGEEITYTVIEVSVEGYTASVSGNAQDGYVITNTHTPTQNPPQPDKPKTGDDFEVITWVAVLAAAAAALAAYVIIGRKKRNQK